MFLKQTLHGFCFVCISFRVYNIWCLLLFLLSHQVISANPVGDREVGAELNTLPKERSQLGASPHVLVALAGDGEGQPSEEVLEVNMFDLLNSSVAFICEDKEGHQSWLLSRTQSSLGLINNSTRSTSWRSSWKFVNSVWTVQSFRELQWTTAVSQYKETSLS